MRRRTFTAASLAALATPAVAAPAVAQATDWPTKPLRMVVPYPPGGPSDISTRIVIDRAAQLLGQPVVFDNKAGASGLIGAEFVKNQPVDHHTFLTTTTAMVCITRHLQPIPFDPDRDIIPVSRMSTSWGAFAVHPSVPANTVAEFVAYAKANPGKLNYGSGGRGITANLAMELLKKAAGLDILHVPYKGSSAALTDLIGGQIDVMMDAGGLVLPQVRQGKLKVLAVSSTARYKELPQVPTIAEQGYPGFEVASWTALVAPAGTPPQVVDLLNKAALKAQARPDVIKASATTGSEPSGSSPRQLREFLASENRKWAEAAQAAGVAPE